MKILVTGANGYIGNGVVNHLISLNQSVIATDFKLDGISEKCLAIEANLFNIDEPYLFFQQPDVILHLAWKDGFVHNASSHLEFLPAHYTFLEKMATAGVKKIVVLGSMHEIGFFEGRITAETPCNPQSLYGISKNALRNATQLLCKSTNILFQWIRGYYIVGNSKKGASIFSKITEAAESGKEFFPFTSGQNQYDFTDYDLFCNQVANVAINNNVLGIINCCSGLPESLASRVERFIKENNYKIKLNYGAYPDRPYDSLAVWGDNSKIIQILAENKRNYE